MGKIYSDKNSKVVKAIFCLTLVYNAQRCYVTRLKWNKMKKSVEVF